MFNDPVQNSFGDWTWSPLPTPPRADGLTEEGAALLTSFDKAMAVLRAVGYLKGVEQIDLDTEAVRIPAYYNYKTASPRAWRRLMRARLNAGKVELADGQGQAVG